MSTRQNRVKKRRRENGKWKMVKTVLCLSLFTIHYFLFTAVDWAQAKSVILLIGDGMGPAIIGISKHYNDMVLKKPALNIEKLMNEGVTGWMMTHSASHLVTDSAAGATAFSCGVKTYNDAVGVDEKGKAVETILAVSYTHLTLPTTPYV